MKKKMRHFEEGGLTQEDIDKMSYSQAFKHFRDQGKGTKFTWRGNKQAAYKEGEEPESWKKKPKKTTMSAEDFDKNMTGKETKLNLPKTQKLDLDEDKAEPVKASSAPAPTPAESDEDTVKRPMPKGRLPAGYTPKVGSGRYDDPTSTFGSRVMSPFRRLVSGDVFGQRKAERVASGAGVDIEEARRRLSDAGMKKGGMVKKYASGGSVKGSSASRRADGIAQRGKTRGKMY